MKKQAVIMYLVLLFPGCDGINQLDTELTTTEPTPCATSGVEDVAEPQHPVDTIAPDILTTIGAFGVPFAGLAATMWRKHKLFQKFKNVVSSIETVKDEVSDLKGKGRAIDVVKKALASQDAGTTKLVRKVKAKL